MIITQVLIGARAKGARLFQRLRKHRRARKITLIGELATCFLNSQRTKTVKKNRNRKIREFEARQKSGQADKIHL